MENTVSLTQKDLERFFSEENIQSMAEEANAQDKRKRLLPVKTFFWIMLLTLETSTKLGALKNTIEKFTEIYYLQHNKYLTISKAAISKQMSERNWNLFKIALERLEKIYPTEVPSVLNQLPLDKLEAIDSSAFDVFKLLRNKFKSTTKEKAQIKVHLKHDIKNSLTKDITVTQQKTNDKTVSFSKEKGTLYLFDLGYWAFHIIDEIIEAGAFFVTRLRGDCNPQIVKSDDSSFVGKYLKDIITLYPNNTLDFEVKLNKYRSNKMKNTVRLVGIKNEDKWHFYVTNLQGVHYTPFIVGEIYRLRWQVEILFNMLKNVINIDKIYSRSENGIQIEIFSSLIVYILTQILMAAAAKESNQPIEYYSFTRSEPFVMGFLNIINHREEKDLEEIFNGLIQIIKKAGLKDTTYINRHIKTRLKEK